MGIFISELLYAQAVFFCGFLGLAFNTGNVITLLMALELLLAGASFSFLIASYVTDDIVGEIFSIFILTVAASESAIGLAMLVVYYKLSGTIEIDRMILLRG